MRVCLEEGDLSIRQFRHLEIWQLDNRDSGIWKLKDGTDKTFSEIDLTPAPKTQTRNLKLETGNLNLETDF